jgi:hypothetical protein
MVFVMNITSNYMRYGAKWLPFIGPIITFQKHTEKIQPRINLLLKIQKQLEKLIQSKPKDLSLKDRVQKINVKLRALQKTKTIKCVEASISVLAGLLGSITNTLIPGSGLAVGMGSCFFKTLHHNHHANILENNLGKEGRRRSLSIELSKTVAGTILTKSVIETLHSNQNIIEGADRILGTANGAANVLSENAYAMFEKINDLLESINIILESLSENTQTE